MRVTGDICPVRLGMSRDALRRLFGEPDDTSTGSRKHPSPAIWKYSNLEFHFGPRADDFLSLIYLEQDEVVKLSIGRLFL
jgi:hypothetical protein